MTTQEQRLFAAALILGGMSANYHHSFIPAEHWIVGAVRLADKLIKKVNEKPMQDTKVSE
jgi:hypothetical protein